MEKKLREVLVHKGDADAISKVREIVKSINGRDTPEYENEVVVRFEFYGTMLDGLACMQAGAMSVG